MRTLVKPVRNQKPLVQLAACAALLTLDAAGSIKAPDDGASEWITVPPQSLVIRAGSPLDLSALTPSGPAGRRGRPRVTPQGKLVFADGGQTARFNCAMIGSGPGRRPGFPTHEEADALALQLHRAGYTLVRLHNADIMLMPAARGNLDIDPERLDRFLYLLAALKRNGIGWMIDVLSVGSKTLDGPHWDRRSSSDDVRVRLLFDDRARKLWLGMVDKVYAIRNPYTGVPTLADPALAFVVGANENSIAFSSGAGRKLPSGLPERFDQWLRQRYSGHNALNRALPDLSASERKGQAIAPPTSWTSSGPRMAQFLTFTAELERQGHVWMTSELKRRGFDGPVLGFHDWPQGLDNRVRSSLPVIDVHAYSGEVSSFGEGGKLFLPATASPEGLSSWTVAAAAHWLDRPMVASEWGQPYPNPTRYESGILFPALAAFQGFSTICQTAFMPLEAAIPAADAKIPPLQGYGVGFDPVARAVETLSAMLFFRGDVRPATRTIAIPFGAEEFGRANSAYLPSAIRASALLARFGLIAPDKIRNLPADSYILRLQTPHGPQGILGKAGAYFDNRAKYREIVDSLKANGTLAPGNRTSLNGVYHSHTGELLVDQPAGQISVVTGRSVAVSTLAPAESINLGKMAVRYIDAPALVAVTALDAKPLHRSARILVILAGDTHSTGLTLSGIGAHRTIQSWGRWPLQMRRVRAELVLKGASPHGWSLSPLALDGSVMATYPVQSSGDGLTLLLDSAAVPGRPTTYFLLQH